LRDGPLGTGRYRLTINSRLADNVGNRLDGNGDGTGGDPYRLEFNVALPTDRQFEGRSNNGFAAATALELTESPAGSGLWLGRGLGMIDPGYPQDEWTDPDYWRFEAKAGDLVTASVATPDGNLNTRMRLYDARGTQLVENDDSGADYDALISHFPIPADGTYFIVAQKNYWVDERGPYSMWLALARGIQMETDWEYGNDSVSAANAVVLETTPAGRIATIAGAAIAPQGERADADFYGWGTLNAGNTVELTIALPVSSRLQPRLFLVDAQGRELADEDGDPTDGHFLATLTADGQYYARVESYWVFDGHLYFVTPTGKKWLAGEADAQNSGGHLVTINDAAEQEWLWPTFRQFGNLWIGLNDLETEGTYAWADGTPLDYTHWRENEPDQQPGHNVAYIEAATGLWLDGFQDREPRALLEWPAQNPTGSGPGYWGQYLLDVLVSDRVPPLLSSVTGVPTPGGTADLPLDSIVLRFSEDLDPATVNATHPLVRAREGRYYWLTDAALSWEQAEAYATSVGGHLVTINDAAEQSFLEYWFAAAQPWIGLTDQTTPGEYHWADGDPANYRHWAAGEPNDGGADFAYLHHNGFWLDHRAHERHRGLIELAGAPDGDGDGVPDAIDRMPGDPVNAYDLR